MDSTLNTANLLTWDGMAVSFVFDGVLMGFGGAAVMGGTFGQGLGDASA